MQWKTIINHRQRYLIFTLSMSFSFFYRKEEDVFGLWTYVSAGWIRLIYANCNKFHKENTNARAQT